MSPQPSAQFCPQCLQETSDTVCRHAFLPTRVHEPATQRGGAEVRDRGLSLHASREAGADVHVERDDRDSEAGSDSESDSDCVSSSGTSDGTDNTDDTTDGTESDGDEHYNDDSDDSEGPSSVEYPKE
jgi:hypothetical protein